MKKLNKKGFTLIELLAVIVVLAIILVITIPTVLGSLGGARQDAFAASANSAADWFEKQYAYCSVGDATISGGAFDDTNYPGTTGSCAFGSSTTPTTLTSDMLKAAGLNGTDYAGTVYVSANGRACVKLSVPSTTSGGSTTYTGRFSALKNYTASSSGC